MKQIKQKRDILSKELMDKSEMIRFVRGPQCKVYPDLAENLPGRGMWVQANKEALQEVVEKRMFNKACHLDCKVDDNFIDELRELLKKRVLNSISISKKSGDLTIGFEKVLEQVKKNKEKYSTLVGESKSCSDFGGGCNIDNANPTHTQNSHRVLTSPQGRGSIFIIASDSGEDGKNKIGNKLDENTIIIDQFTGAELQIALGQDTVVVYGIIKKSKMADKIIMDYKKWLHFC